MPPSTIMGMSRTEPALIGIPHASGRRYAEVAVDVGLAHLDHPFDYLVPDDTEVSIGCRVKVRFAGRLCDAVVLSIRDHTDHDRVQPLAKVVSTEAVLTPTIAGLVRAVADHWAGGFTDVLRLAVPPRHATTEKAKPRERALPDADELRELPAGPFASAAGGSGFLDALAQGDSPRAAWQPVPVDAEPGDWAAGFARAAAATWVSGRGSLCIVPDVTDLERVAAACREVFGKDAVVTLSADMGPSARYRSFLAVLRGQAPVVVGTRAAAFAPVRDLGLVALWDDGDDLLAEPRAPYPHVREVLALRASRESTAVLFASHARTAEVADLVARDWLRDLVTPRTVARPLSPVVRIAADHDRAQDRDAAAHSARLPHDVFTVMRAGLAQGPVLVQVPRAGYLASLVCQHCREPVRCPQCSGPARADRSRVTCSWAGHPINSWRCAECGGTRWRAPVVGAIRTAEELGKAFPLVPIRRSSGDRILTEVNDEPALVVATPGAEPRACGGYAAAVLLDTVLLVQRPELRAREEALRRWWNATALVRPGAEGGTVMAVGPADSSALQAFVRMDPVGTAERELDERRQALLPPASRMVAIEGPEQPVGDVVRAVVAAWRKKEPDTEPLTLGPGPIDGPAHAEEPWVRTSILVPARLGATLTTQVRAVMATRSAHKHPGTVRIRVDPRVI